LDLSHKVVEIILISIHITSSSSSSSSALEELIAGVVVQIECNHMCFSPLWMMPFCLPQSFSSPSSFPQVAQSDVQIGYSHRHASLDNQIIGYLNVRPIRRPLKNLSHVVFDFSRHFQPDNPRLSPLPSSFKWPFPSFLSPPSLTGHWHHSAHIGICPFVKIHQIC
jgi:hypothetical protein